MDDIKYNKNGVSIVEVLGGRKKGSIRAGHGCTIQDINNIIDMGIDEITVRDAFPHGGIWATGEEYDQRMKERREHINTGMTRIEVREYLCSLGWKQWKIDRNILIFPDSLQDLMDSV
jgi:hypothetical protein